MLKGVPLRWGPHWPHTVMAMFIWGTSMIQWLTIYTNKVLRSVGLPRRGGCKYTRVITHGPQGHVVRYQSPMNLQQVCSTLPSSTIPFPSSSLSYFCCISDTPLFVPVPLVSSFVPAFPVSLISIPISQWSSHLLHIVLLPHSCLSLFHASTFVPSPWLSQANSAV